MITLTVIGEKIIVSICHTLSLSNETPKIVAPFHKQQTKLNQRLIAENWRFRIRFCEWEGL